MTRHLLHTGWQFKQRDSDLPTNLRDEHGWLPAAVPGTVHQDLMAAGKLADPYMGLNEKDAQWVGEKDWVYRTTFNVAPEELGRAQIDLCFDGLDTFAQVWLNGTLILTGRNMFTPYRVPVKHLLKPAGNTLEIAFESALNVGKKLESELGPRAVWNGDSSRVYVRKAQYHYGWDWGPTLMTAGVWRAVYLDAYDARLTELYCPVDLSADLRQARIYFHARIHNPTQAALTLEVTLTGPEGNLIDKVRLPATNSQLSASFSLAEPQLWWPNGYGEQPLYTVHASLYLGDQRVYRIEQRIGIRRIYVIQEPVEGERGTSFHFEVNDLPIFCGGANWIPADLFIPRIDADKYRYLLELASNANMQMLRVWGGGIYEEDLFYDLCDELGLLVWQDFMFACGIYPAHLDFQNNVRDEAEANVRRLRHHACIALWCGNNEDYQIAQSKQLYDHDDNGDLIKSGFPARELYERLLPDVCAWLDPATYYWPGSAYGGRDVSDQTVGDRHTWEVWHAGTPYQQYGQFEGRFVSEFGMQAYPDMLTINRFTRADEREIAHPVIVHHNKADGGEGKLAGYLQANLPPAKELTHYVYATQLLQAEALGAAFRLYRRRWGTPDHRAVAGALVWQLNDCWPVTSWALIDDQALPKAAYYAVKRALQPVTLEMATIDDRVQLWVVNGLVNPIEATLLLSGWSTSGESLWEKAFVVMVRPNAVASLPFASSNYSAPILSGRLMMDGRLIARTALWPEPLKNMHLVPPKIQIQTQEPGLFEFSTDRPAKGVMLSGGAAVLWSDNGFDLFPNDPRLIRTGGVQQNEIVIHTLADLSR